jgi:hypothetical protein
MAYSLLRIFALWIFGTNVLTYFSLTIAQMVYDIGSGRFDNFDIYSLLMNIFLFIFWFLVSGILWFKADKYSKYFQKNTKKISDQKANEDHKFVLFLQLSVIILGLYFSITSVAQIVTGFIHLSILKEYYNPHQIDMRLVDLIKPGLTFILGISCLSFNKVIVLFIKKFKGI